MSPTPFLNPLATVNKPAFAPKDIQKKLLSAISKSQKALIDSKPATIA